MRLVAVLLVVLVALAGCSSIYHAENANGGYSDTRVDVNVFRVTFKGKPGLVQAQTNDMALLRGAELALRNGFGFFISSDNATPGSAPLPGTNVVSIPATTITIICYVVRPETVMAVYDAKEVVARLGPIYRK
jgi:hypothetical protein